ncbi:MAG: hypothetical protein ACM3MB_03755 [Acidobacteriota bacterium]
MPIRIKKVFLLMSLTIVCGCAAFHPAPLSFSRTAADLESRTLASPGLRTFIESNLHRGGRYSLAA